MNYQPTQSDISVCEGLKNYLRHYNVTEGQFARIAGLSASHVNRIVRMKLSGAIRQSTRNKIATAITFRPVAKKNIGQEKTKRKSKTAREKLPPSENHPLPLFLDEYFKDSRESVKDFCRRTGVSTFTINSLRAGRYMSVVSDDTRDKIMDALVSPPGFWTNVWRKIRSSMRFN
jgi:plasmid maintenance system antidote protein VapI